MIERIPNPHPESGAPITVYADTEMDALRRKRCLCLNCERLGQCVMASELYRLCRIGHLALAVTRCPVWMPKLGGAE